MSKIMEIEASLPALTDGELVRLARTLNRIYRERHNEILYDDVYGVFTEVELIASAEEAFLTYDREEEEHAKRTTR